MKIEIYATLIFEIELFGIETFSTEEDEKPVEITPDNENRGRY